MVSVDDDEGVFETLHFAGDGFLIIAEENDIGLMTIENLPATEGGITRHDDEIGIEISDRFCAFLVGILRGVVFQY